MYIVMYMYGYWLLYWISDLQGHFNNTGSQNKILEAKASARDVGTENTFFMNGKHWAMKKTS
jgi:hypothetical protein